MGCRVSGVWDLGFGGFAVEGFGCLGYRAWSVWGSGCLGVWCFGLYPDIPLTSLKPSNPIPTQNLCNSYCSPSPKYLVLECLDPPSNRKRLNLNPKPQILNPEPYTLNPKPYKIMIEPLYNPLYTYIYIYTYPYIIP